MEDQFDKIFYLVGAIIWYALRKIGSKGYQKPTLEEATAAPASTTDSWESQTSKAKALQVSHPPTHAPITETAIQAAHPGQNIRLPYSFSVNQTTQPKKIDRILSRYSGWKKALVMSEIIHPLHAGGITRPLQN